MPAALATLSHQNLEPKEVEITKSDKTIRVNLIKRFCIE
jgi:hypothetical protein